MRQKGKKKVIVFLNEYIIFVDTALNMYNIMEKWGIHLEFFPLLMETVVVAWDITHQSMLVTCLTLHLTCVSL